MYKVGNLKTNFNAFKRQTPAPVITPNKSFNKPKFQKTINKLSNSLQNSCFLNTDKSR